jgi:hypothetical protein
MLIRQSDHDDHCGRLMAHWTSGLFWQPTHRQLLTIAVALHDAGSSHWEDRAILDHAGLPWTYWGIPADDHLDLHRHGISVAADVHPYVGLLVSMHAVGIHRDRLHIDQTPSPWHIREDFTPKVGAFIAEQTHIQKRLLREAQQRCDVSLTEERLMNDFKLFEMVDTLSVWIAENMPIGRDMVYVPDRAGEPMTVTIERAGEWAFRLSPYPFEDDKFECPIVARLMPKTPFRHDDDFREAWYSAKVLTLPYVCVR